MKPTRFFTQFAIAILHQLGLGKSKPITRRDIAEKQKELMTDPATVGMAQAAGNQRRLRAWQRSCIQAYERKIAQGKPNGIPSWFLATKTPV